MNERIKELAVQAGLSREFSVSGLWLADDEELKRFAELVRADERELAKPEQDHGFDRTASHMVGEYVDTAQSDNQEPLAWATFDGEGNFDFRSYEDNKTYRDDYLKRNGKKYTNWVLPLYVAPPRKPWVALTHADLMKEFGYTDELLRITAYGVEKIIKDKNT